MAEMRYFKKLQPHTKVVINSRIHVQFTTLDGLVGYYGTNSQEIIDAFGLFKQQERYGIEEIEAEEFFRDYVEVKKNNPQGLASAKPWREEFGVQAVRARSPLETLGPEKVAAAVGVTNHKDLPASPVVTTVAESLAVAPKPEYKPVVGTRAKKKKD